MSRGIQPDDIVRDLVIAACGDFGGNDGRFTLDNFRAVARGEFDLKDYPTREWAEATLRNSDVAETVDGGFSWRLKNVRRAR